VWTCGTGEETAYAREAATCGAGGVVDRQHQRGGFLGHRSRRRKLVTAAGERASRGIDRAAGHRLGGRAMGDQRPKIA
jgi:hypothetical protein